LILVTMMMMLFQDGLYKSQYVIYVGS
jgi:hypothetical protein